MGVIIQILIIFILVNILIQDFKSRTVYWFCFPLLALGSFFIGIMTLSVQVYFENTLINAVVITIELAVLTTLILIKNRNFNSVWQFIGLGDILLLYSTCFCFSPINFLLFQIVSLLLSLALHFSFSDNKIYKENGSSVALAGWQAIVLALVILSNVFFKFDSFSDYLVMQSL